MVVDERRDEAVDELFHAVADPTRRDILRRCAACEPSVSRLAQAYSMSFAARRRAGAGRASRPDVGPTSMKGTN
jgi:DNA-binding transcriptional ArsR family regulator